MRSAVSFRKGVAYSEARLQTHFCIYEPWKCVWQLQMSFYFS